MFRQSYVAWASLPSAAPGPASGWFGDDVQRPSSKRGLPHDDIRPSPPLPRSRINQPQPGDPEDSGAGS